MRERLSKESSRWRIKVEFHAPLYIVQQQMPASFSTLTETSAGALFEAEHGDIADVARFLATRDLFFVALEPPDLRAELLAMAERMRQSAGQ